MRFVFRDGDVFGKSSADNVIRKVLKSRFIDHPRVKLSVAQLLSETRPEESPDSYKDIVFILTLTILPAPLCIMPFVTGVDEPVRII